MLLFGPFGHFVLPVALQPGKEGNNSLSSGSARKCGKNGQKMQSLDECIKLRRSDRNVLLALNDSVCVTFAAVIIFVD
jgi:hypothetical protein